MMTTFVVKVLTDGKAPTLETIELEIDAALSKINVLDWTISNKDSEV